VISELTVEYEFEAAHYLPHVPVGHKCGRVHGHNYSVVLTLRGPVKKPQSWVIDFADVDAAWGSLVFEKLDHQKLNDVVGLENPTAELLAWWIYWRLRDRLPVVKVTVWETRRYSASYGEVA